MIDTSKYEGHNRMYAMRCTDDENDMLLFIEDHFEHSPSMDEWWPEVSEKFGEDHRFSPHPHRFYSNMECEHAWEGISEVNLRLMADAPLLLEELKRAYQLILDAAWQIHWSVGTTASSSHLSSKEWDEDIYAPAQAWRKQVQDILDASEEGCPWKESEGE